MTTIDKRFGGQLFFRGSPSGACLDYKDGMTSWCRLMNSFPRLKQLESLAGQVRSCQKRLATGGDPEAIIAELERIESEYQRN